MIWRKFGKAPAAPSYSTLQRWWKRLKWRQAGGEWRHLMSSKVKRTWLCPPQENRRLCQWLATRSDFKRWGVMFGSKWWRARTRKAKISVQAFTWQSCWAQVLPSNWAMVSFLHEAVSGFDFAGSPGCCPAPRCNLLVSSLGCDGSVMVFRPEGISSSDICAGKVNYDQDDHWFRDVNRLAEFSLQSPHELWMRFAGTQVWEADNQSFCLSWPPARYQLLFHVILGPLGDQKERHQLTSSTRSGRCGELCGQRGGWTKSWMPGILGDDSGE